MGSKLDEYILEVMSGIPEVQLHWAEIRDALLCNEEIANQPGFKESSFNVKVWRSLERLVRQGIIDKHEGGHKNTTYFLSKNAIEKWFKDKVQVSFTLIGTYKPGDSFEQFKDKTLKRLSKLFEPQLRDAFKKVTGKKRGKP